MDGRVYNLRIVLPRFSIARLIGASATPWDPLRDHSISIRAAGVEPSASRATMVGSPG